MALHNLARMTSATTGTGTLTLGSAVSGFLSFADAGVADGETVTYAIRDGANSEIGRGVYTASGTTLTRATIYESTNSGNAINCSGSQEVFVTASAEDVVFDHSICQGRLTLTSGTALTTTDVTAATNVYFTPLNGNRIGLFGSGWKPYTFTELTLSLTGLAADTNYDVFIYDNAGTLTLEAVAWTNNTTRATALTLQDGVYLKNGATGRRYLGTFRTTGTIGQTEDSKSKRFLWNYYNRAPRFMSVVDTTNTWTYASATWQAANNSSNNRVSYVCGVSDELIMASVRFRSQTGTGIAGAMGIGIDSTSANSAQLMSEVSIAGSSLVDNGGADYSGYPGLGYHYVQWLEYARVGTVTFYGDAGTVTIQSGMMAIING